MVATLVCSMDYSDSSAPVNELLSHEMSQLSRRPKFSTFITKVLSHKDANTTDPSRPGHPMFRVSEEFLDKFCSVLKLSTVVQVMVALGAVRSDNKEGEQHSLKFLQKKLNEISPASSNDKHDASGVRRLPADALHAVLCLLRGNEKFRSDETSTNQILDKLRRAYPKLMNALEQRLGSNNDTIIPLLNDDSLPLFKYGENLKTNKRSNAALASEILNSADIAGLLIDLGYSCTASIDAFRDALRQFGRGSSMASHKGKKNKDLKSLTNLEAARIVGAMARTMSGLEKGSSRSSQDSHSNDGGKGAGGHDSSSSKRTGGQGKSWKSDVVGFVFQHDHKNLDWTVVMQNLDHPEFKVPDTIAFAFIMKVFKIASGRQEQQNLPYSAFFSGKGPDQLWKNTAGQLSLLKQAIVAPPTLFTFAYSPNRQPPFIEDSANTVPGQAPQASYGTPNQAWCSLDLIRVLILLGNSHYVLVRRLFEYPIRHCPELLLLGLGQSTNSWNDLRKELAGILVPLFVGPGALPTAEAVLRPLWAKDERLTVAGIARAYLAKPDLLPHLLEVSVALGKSDSSSEQSPTCFSRLLELPLYRFTIDFAAIAACPPNGEPLLDLEAWLMSQIGNVNNEAGTRFANICLRWLQEKQGINVQTLAIFLKVLTLHKGRLDPAGAQAFATFHEVCLRKFPQLSAIAESDIEEQANAYFQKIYTSQQSIEDVIEMLKRFKVSADPREKDIFACMIHNLFDEYRFFDKYPEKELRITGILFGALIQNELVSSITLGIALRYVLEALRKPPDNKMYRFGKYALEQFMTRLREWPQYCAHIVQIPHLREVYPDLVAEIQRALAMQRPDGGQFVGGDNSMVGNQDPSSAAAGSSSSATLNSASPVYPSPTGYSIGAATGSAAGQQGGNMTPLMLPSDPSQSINTDLSQPQSHASQAGNVDPNESEEDDPVPPEPEEPELPPPTPPSQETVDKINFVVNNITARNVREMVAKARPLVTSDLYDWFAHFLVTGRIANQANYHQAYFELLRGLESKELLNAVLKCCCRNVKRLLKSDKIRTEVSERSILKTLGSWLGRMTLAQTKPLLQRDLDIKEMLYMAYEEGRLIAVLPFIAKILEAAKDNRIFRPPNPWTMGLMNALREVYEVPDLKLFLKFEVEILCKNLNLDPKKDLIPPGILQRRKKPDMAGNRDFTNKSSKNKKSSAKAADTSSRETSNARSNTSATTQEQQPSQAQAESSQQENKNQQQSAQPGPFPDPLIPNLANYVHINPSLVLFENNPKLRRVVPLAVDRAIREIISPVVERSVTIACITTRELVTKDFAMEPDENKIRKAAHLMVSNLAGSLALVTCKEPLRVSISQHLRTLLAGVSGSIDQAALEQLVGVCASENLELGCMLIEKASTEKAMRDIDETIGQEIMTRQKRIEEGGPFYDVNLFAPDKRFPRELPESLRPSQTGLKPFQLHVYESFVRLPRNPPQAQQQSPVDNATANQGSPLGSVPQQHGGKQLAQAQHQERPQHQGVSQQIQRHVHANHQQDQTLDRKMALDQLLSSLSSLDQALSSVSVSSLTALPSDHDAIGCIRRMQVIGSAIASDARDPVVNKFGESVFKRLYNYAVDNASDIKIEAMLGVLEFLTTMTRNTAAWQTEVATWVNYQYDEDIATKNDGKVMAILLSGLLRIRLLRPQDLDKILLRSFDSNRTEVAIATRVAVTRKVLFNDRLCGPADLRKTLTSLEHFARVDANLAQQLQLPQFLEQFGGSIAQTSQAQVNADNEKKQRIRDHVTYLLDNWLMVCNSGPGTDQRPPGANEKAYLQMLQQQGVLKCDQNSSRFFAVLFETARDRALATATHGGGESFGKDCSMDFSSIDAVAKLFVLLLKYMDSAKLKLLEQILNTIAQVLIDAHDSAKVGEGNAWDQRPYFRIFASLLCQLAEPDPALNAVVFHVLTMVATTFHTLRPSRVGGFTFAWLELICHRHFMPKLLLVKAGSREDKTKGWPLVQQLLIDLFQSMQPYLQTSELTDATRVLYKGMLRVLLVLLHDFPEFLCDYHFSFCDVIPPSCVQLRNLILSAFPRNMRLPDPFVSTLKVDRLPEISQPPRVLSDFSAALHYKNIEADLIPYLKTRQPSDFLNTLCSKLLLSPATARTLGTRYNVPTLNALVLYVGTHASQALKGSQDATSSSIPMDIFQHLCEHLDLEGRYLFINAIANQLRYPNSHTYYFSCVLLYLFQESKKEIVQEQITRVLLERLIVHRPHPWGLLITFLELLKNPRYKFMKKTFTSSAPEIQRLFASVAQSCIGADYDKKVVESGNNGGGTTEGSGIVTM
eukprot:g5319.t1